VAIGYFMGKTATKFNPRLIAQIPGILEWVPLRIRSVSTTLVWACSSKEWQAKTGFRQVWVVPVCQRGQLRNSSHRIFETGIMTDLLRDDKNNPGKTTYTPRT
jgi:hypothetical protein